MNTKFKINGQIVLTISTLLTAMWLPLTTFAQDASKTGDLTQGTNTRAENCTHCQTMDDSHDRRACQHSFDALTFLPGPTNGLREESVGFSETDPTIRQSQEALIDPQGSNRQVQQVSVGFSETDPASRQTLDVATVLQTSKNRVQQVYAGFAETDPAVMLYRSFREIQHQTLVDCHERNAKGIALTMSEFSKLD